MIRNCLADRPLPVYGNGSNIRDWLHVADHCRALMTVVRRGCSGRTYNIGGCNERTNLDVVHLLCDIMDEIRPRTNGESHRALVSFVTDRPGHDQRYAIDASRIREELGWQPTYDFASGLRQTVLWYLSHGDWLRSILADRYAGERLGVIGQNAERGQPTS